MHTLKIVAIGFAVLIFCLVLGRLINASRGMVIAAIVFVPIWLIGAGLNMYNGIHGAGYSVADELPVFFLVFLVPAAVSIAVWWKIH